MELKDIFEENCWLTKIGRGSFWMFGVCVYCAMVTCGSVFLYMTTGTVSDEWCVFKINFLYFSFCKFLFVCHYCHQSMRSVLGNVG